MDFRAPNLRRRVAPLLLLAAGLVSYLVIGKTLPHDQNVAIDLGAGATGVTSVEIAWSRPGAADEPALSTRWSFTPGKAPRRLPVPARLANGPWVAEVEVGRADAPAPARWTKQVDLRGDPMTLPLHEALQ